MKKIVTLSMAVLLAASVFAQSTKEEARRVILGQPKKSSSGTYPQDSRDVVLGGNGSRSYPDYPNSYPRNNYPANSRGAQIDRINREYDYKIQTIRNNRALSPRERDRIIRDLNNERYARIRQINSQYGRSDNRYDRRHDDDDYRKGKKNGKHDNGKHLGWYKGKGNPHKHHDD